MSELTYKRKRGFFTFAQNNSKHDYLRMAYALALSLKATQKDNGYLTVGITPGQEVPAHYLAVFDSVVEIPWGDAAEKSEWKLENEWKAYHMTPYEETIKLDCDMLFTNDISYLWGILEKKDFWVATKVVTYRGEAITSDICRKSITACGLPNAYSAFTYFKKCNTSKEVFSMMELITYNWDKFSWEFMGENRPEEGFSTDVALALAIHLTGNTEKCTEDSFDFPSFVHMKSELQDWNFHVVTSEWTKNISYFLTDALELKIANYKQELPVHYHCKDFITDPIIKKLETAANASLRNI